MPAAAAAATMLLLAGCATPAGPAATEPADDPGAEPAGDGASEFCAQTEGLGEALLTLLDSETDAATGAESIATAKQILTDVEPPAQITEAWAFLTHAMTTFDEALADADLGAGEKLQLEGEEAFATIIQLPGQVEVVGVHLQEECGTDLGMTAPALAELCDAVDPAFLGSVFSTVPAGEQRRWGDSTVECVWTEGDTEVGAVVGPSAAMTESLLSSATPTSQVDMDGYAIDVYAGAFGPLRGSTKGSTAVAVVGDSTVLVSVSSGDDAADELKAIALAALVADELG